MVARPTADHRRTTGRTEAAYGASGTVGVLSPLGHPGRFLGVNHGT